LATIPKTVARAIVINDGHLVLEGDETADELRLALSYLVDHMCPTPPGIPASVNLSKHYRIALGVIRH
jgi:hypothetical protein